MENLIGKTIKSVESKKVRDDFGDILTDKITVITFTDDSSIYLLAYFDTHNGESVNEFPTEVKIYSTKEDLLSKLDFLGYTDTSNYKLIE